MESGGKSWSVAPSLRAWVAVAVPLAVGVLQLTHPTWSDGSVADAVLAAGAWWIPLHVLLIAGYVALAVTLWPPRAFGRALLVAFLVCNTAFLAVDGLVVGSLASSNPSAADDVWNSPLTLGLADLTGALWCAALLAIATSRVAAPRTTLLLAAVIWLTFVGSLVVPAMIVVGSLALVVAVYRTYLGRGAPAGVTFGLLALAALARQHVGLEAALGMLWLALLALGDALHPAASARGRSAPAASSPPESG
jgi:hypothetical protein